MCFVTDKTQRILSYTTTKDRMVLAVALICSVGSGVVRVSLYFSDEAK
jgi:hypothetical protein